MSLLQNISNNINNTNEEELTKNNAIIMLNKIKDLNYLNIKDKKFMHGFNIMKVFKFGDTIRGIVELTSSDLACKELDVTYWRKFMTDPEIEEAANKIFFYTYEKNDEVFIIRRLGCKARIKLIEQREDELL